jgi:adenylate kinase
MNIVILGPQGSGKSTQAKLLAENLGITHISTGKLLRDIANDPKNDLNHLVKKQTSSGELVSNAVVNKVLSDAVEKAIHTGGFIIDGTPRKLDQLTTLDELLDFYKQKLDFVFFIDTSVEESKKRLALRAKKENRADDTEEAINKRLKIYHTETKDVLNEYKKRGILTTVGGNGSIEDIQQSLQNHVSSAKIAQ